MTVENTAGHLFPVPVEIDASTFRIGDAIRVTGDPENWEVAAPENFVIRTRVGIVKAVEEDFAVFDTSDGVFSGIVSAEYSLVEGNTVVLNLRHEVLKVMSEEPIRQSPIQIEHSDDGFDPAKFIQTASGSVEWSTFGGFPAILAEAKEIVDVHLERREHFAAFGVSPVRGVIFAGPPGTGKTFLGRIMATKADATLYLISGADLGGGIVGESEGRLQRIYDHAAKQKLSIIFIDEIDNITHRRTSDSNDHGDRLVSTFLENMDGFTAKNNVLTIGTTNRVDDIDPALLRPGRFGLEVKFHKPGEADRIKILEAGAATKAVSPGLPHSAVAAMTEGWSGAELEAIWNAATTYAIAAKRTVIAADHYLMGAERVRDRKAEGRLLG